MIRKVFKKSRNNGKIAALIEKYKIKQEYLSVNRKSVSRAVMVGLFIAFIPMPLQMVAILFILPFYHFNAPIALLMVLITNPLTMPFIYYIEYLTGNILLMNDALVDAKLTLEWFRENFDAIFFPLYVGALFYSSIFALAGYFFVNWLWKRSVHEEKRQKKKPPEL